MRSRSYQIYIFLISIFLIHVFLTQRNNDFFPFKLYFSQVGNPPCKTLRPLPFILNASLAPSLSTAEMLSRGILDGVNPDGYFAPEDCAPEEGPIALIIPYRNRTQQLNTFLPYMIAFLKGQRRAFQIFIVEQIDALAFNRASLLNVGFMEALKQQKFGCFVFHDVDHLPENPEMNYECNEEGPVHLAVAVSKYRYAMPYGAFFGGVVAFTQEQFERVNGFSNCYWGWGAEDDDIHYRTILRNYTIQRPSPLQGRFYAISHKPEEGNPDRNTILGRYADRMDKDGINSLRYNLLNIMEELSHSRVRVQLRKQNEC